MPEQSDPFSPHRVDESIEQFFSIEQPDDTSPTPAHAEPQEQLIRDMQRLYDPERRQYLRAMQRVEDRLIVQHITRHRQPVALPERQPQPAYFRKKQQGSFLDMENKRFSKIGRRASLLVAVVIMVALVGSLLVVLNLTHLSTTTASGPNGTPTPTPTMAPTSSPTGSANPGHIVYTYPTSMDDFYAFAWSPDSKHVASSTGGKVQIRNAANGKLERTALSGALALSWSPDGRYLAMGSENVQIIDTTTGAVVHTFPSATAFAGISAGAHFSAALPLSGGNMVYATAWSPDGKLMATSLNGNAYGNVIVVWKVSTGQVLYTYRGQTGQSGPGSVAWSPDGRYIASAGYDGTIQVWAALTGKVIFTRNNCGTDVAWALTGMQLAFHCANNTMQVWNVATSSMITSRQDSGSMSTAVAWSPDGKEIANTSNDNIVIWNAATGKIIYTFTKQGGQYARALAWSPNGKYIVSGSGGETEGSHAMIWNA